MLALAFLFLAFLLPVGLVAWSFRTRISAGRIALFAPVLAVFGAFASAHYFEHSDRLTVDVTALRLDSSRFVDLQPGERAVYFTIADRPEVGDLVVPATADRRFALASRTVEPRVLLTIEVAKNAQGVIATTLHATSTLPNERLNLPGMDVEFSGETSAAKQPTKQVALESGARLSVSIFRVDPDGSRRLRRTVNVMRSSPATADSSWSIRIGLDTPMQAFAGSCSLTKGNSRQLNLRLQPASSTGSNDLQFDGARNLVFDGLGQGGDQPLLEPQLLGPIADAQKLCSANERVLTWPDSASGETPRLELRTRLASLPLFIPLFVLMISLGWWLILGPCWLKNPAFRVAIPFVHLFLGYRLMFSVAGLYYDAGLTRAPVIGEAAFAMLCAPPIFAAMLATPSTTRTTFFNLLLVVVGGAAGLMIWLESWPGWRAIWPLPVAIALLGLKAFADNWLSLQVTRVSEKITNHIIVIRAHIEARSSDALAMVQDSVGLAGLVLLGTAIARIALAYSPLHARERVFGLPLSAMYVPVLIYGFAVLLSRITDPNCPDQLRIRRVAGLLILFALNLLLVPFLVSDSGFTFLAAPPVAVALLLVAWHSKTVQQCNWLKFMLNIPAVLMLVFVLGLSAYLARQTNLPSDASLFAQANLTLAYSGNSVRLVQFWDPALLYSLGSLDARAAIEQQQLLAQLTGSLAGEGWLAPAQLHLLRDVQFSDNAAAVHVMWPFGRAAALALLIAVLAFFRADRRMWPVNDAQTIAGNSAWLAAALLLWTATYMVCANLLLVPFTGRNIYLLSPTSGGDLLEGALLVLIAVWPMRQVSEVETTS